MLERFRTFAHDKVAAIRSLVAERARALRPVAILKAPVEPLPLSREDGWARATRAVVAAMSSFDRIRNLQAAAGSQIDAADYTLRTLIEELSLVMPMPADGSELRALLATVAELPEPLAEERTLAA